MFFLNRFILNGKFSFKYLIIWSILAFTENFNSRYRSLYQIIQQDNELTGFNSIVQISKLAKQYLNYSELTAFVPNNEAFRKYPGEILENLALYHITFEMNSLEALNTTTNSLTPVVEEFPPLWITRAGGDIFVNNAKIIRQQSNYLLRIHHDELRKEQVILITGKME